MGDSNINSKVEGVFNRRPFPQITPLTELKFQSFCKDRGINLWFNGLSHLNESGFIQPLTHDPYVGYHPFQVWIVHKFVSEIEIDLAPAFFYQGFNWGGVYKALLSQWKGIKNRIADFNNLDDVKGYYEILPLLLWIECYYYPQIRGSRHNILSFKNTDSKAWYEWRDGVDLESWLSEFEISLELVKQWHWKFLWTAYQLDPIEDWYLLIRSASREKRNKLKGTVRLAYDFYELAEMLRLYLSDISEESVRKEWDPRGHPDTPWIERVYGIDEVKFGSPELLKPLTREYGLDPSFRLIWLVEGETEEGFIRTYYNLIGLDTDQYVTFRNFTGEKKFQSRLAFVDQQLEAAKREQCFVTLTFDEHPKTRRRIEELLHEQKAVTTSYLVNNPDFELQNFSPKTLIEVALDWISDGGESVPESISINDITRELDALIQAGEIKQLINAIRKSISGHSINSRIVHKGKEWGSRLAKHVVAEQERQDRSNESLDESRSKIERQILYMLRASQPYINYPKSIENIEIAEF